jgi:hypothetical protein
MLDVVNMHEQFDNNSACNLTTGKLHSMVSINLLLPLPHVDTHQEAG